jgi:hypothetical protein
MLRELGILLAAEQRLLLKTFQERQAAFIDSELKAALEELHRWIRQLPSGRRHDRTQAFSRASEIAQVGVENWLTRIEPEADALYRNATQRFTALTSQFLTRLADTGDPAFARLPRTIEPEVGLRETRHFYATNLMSLTRSGPIAAVRSLVVPRETRLIAIRRDASAYLERLLRSNTTRVVFDLEQRVEVSRRRLESELRFLLQQITSSADHALSRARVRLQAGYDAVNAEISRVDALRQRLDRVTRAA